MQSLKKIHAWAQMKVPLSKILASLCSLAGWFESYLVEDPGDMIVFPVIRLTMIIR